MIHVQRNFHRIVSDLIYLREKIGFVTQEQRNSSRLDPGKSPVRKSKATDAECMEGAPAGGTPTACFSAPTAGWIR